MRRRSVILGLMVLGIWGLFGVLLFGLPPGTDYYFSFYPAASNWLETGALYEVNHHNPPWSLFILVLLRQMTFAGGQAALLLVTFVAILRIWYDFLPADAGIAGPLSLALSLFNLYVVDLLIRVQIDGLILVGLLFMLLALRHNQPELLGIGWLLAVLRPTSHYLFGLYSIWLAYRRGYLWRALWLPASMFGLSLLIFGNWPLLLYEQLTTRSPTSVWRTSWLRIAEYLNISFLWAIAMMILFGLASWWVWVRYAAMVDERTRVAFLLAASLMTTPYAQSYHYSIIFPIFLTVLLPWRMWLALPLLLTSTFLVLVRVPFGAGVAWVDMSMPLIVWMALVFKLYTAQSSPDVYPSTSPN
ncbi:MAG: hypothetical protein ACLFTK_06415 [Anaerolineales bacterium]